MVLKKPLLRKVNFSLYAIAGLSLAGTMLCVTAACANTITINPLQQPGFVTVPNNPSYEVSLAAILLQPGASNLNYVIYNKELPVQSPTWNEKEITPNFSGAFELGARRLFTAGRDVSLDWTHMTSTTNNSVATPSASYFLGPDYEIGPAGIPIRNASGEAEFKYDVINLVAGQTVDFGNHVSMRFFGGLSNAYLREQVTATYTGNVLTQPYPGPFSSQQEVTANYTGIGPRAGVDAVYVSNSGFGMMGEAAASVLIGKTFSKSEYTSSSVQLQTQYNQSVNSQYIEDQDVHQVVPGFDAKLALTYRHAMTTNSLLTVKAGYEGAVYVNAISQYIPGTLVTPLETGGIFVATMNHTLSNYSVQGPFLEADVQFS